MAVCGRYRQTPYHDHIQKQMGWSSVAAWEDSLRDVLGLRNIYEGLARQTRSGCREALNLSRFFCQSNPDLVAYMPVPVRKLVGGAYQDRNGPPDYADLTALLGSSEETRSILLVAGSGSGKTVAARKSFHDCIVIPPRESRPLLGDYLPVWINSATPGNSDTIGSSDKDQLIERLILNACELRTLSLRGFQCWLDHPKLKLLLFFDLNSWGVEGRQKIAEALPEFLTRYRLGDRPAGHRAVVAYRSSTAIDGPREALLQGELFSAYDLDPLPTEQAEHYLRNIRAFEEDVYVQLGQQPPTRDIDAEVGQLRRLLRRHVGNTLHRVPVVEGNGDDPPSVISTPLLMHFCSSLRGEELAEVRTLSDLYERVINRHLERETRQLAPANHDAARQRTLAAMMRLAVLILSRSENSVAVGLQEFKESLLDPDSGNPDEQLGGGSGWWPENAFWRNASWISWGYAESEFNQLLEFSLVQRDGEQLRFMHDSFVYYLTARALRYPAPDQVQLRRKWTVPAALQLRFWPGPQQEVAVFLGGMLNKEQFEALFLELMAGPADATTARLVTALIRGADGRVNTATRLQAEYLRRSGWTGLQQPQVFLSEIHEALLTEADADCRALADALVVRMRQEQRTWIRNLHPRYRDTSVTIHHRSSGVTCVAAWINPADQEDIRIVSGCADGTVELWDPQTAWYKTIIKHDKLVRCLEVLPDGRVVSGSDDNTVRLWDPNNPHTAETIIKHDNRVECLTVLPDGRVVSGSADDTVRLWDPNNPHTAETIIKHDKWVRCVAVLPDGRVILGLADDTVRLWDPNNPQAAETIINHGMHVLDLAVLPNGRVAMESKQHPKYFHIRLHLWDPGNRQPPQHILTHSSDMYCQFYTAILPDGCGVSAAKKIIYLWNPQTRMVKKVFKHESTVNSLAVLPDGRVISADEHGNMCLWDPQGVFEQDSSVNCLAVLSGGGVVSGGADNTVRLWNPHTRENEIIIEHEGEVECLVALSDGGVVSGSKDGTVRKWDPVTRRNQIIIEHENERFRKKVRCLAVFPDGRVISGGEDGTVRLWIPHTGENEIIIRHSNLVTCLAILPDGGVVSGGTDNYGFIWHPEWGCSKICIENEGRVQLLAALPDGRIISGAQLGRVRLRSAYSETVGRVRLRSGYSEGTELIIDHKTSVSSLAVLPDGGVVSVGGDRHLRRWDPQTRQCTDVKWCRGLVKCLAVFSDGRVVLGLKDRTVGLWDPESETETVRFFTGSAVRCIACSDDSTRIYLGLANGEVLFLQLEQPSLI